ETTSGSASTCVPWRIRITSRRFRYQLRTRTLTASVAINGRHRPRAMMTTRTIDPRIALVTPRATIAIGTIVAKPTVSTRPPRTAVATRLSASILVARPQYVIGTTIIVITLRAAIDISRYGLGVKNVKDDPSAIP